jgi:septal ring factor EnvC (AmiA/AmiB activator)
MIIRKSKQVFVFIILFSICLNVMGQTASKKMQLQREYNNLKKEIKEIESNIQSRKKLQNISLKEIADLNAKIETRKKLVVNMESQLKEIDQELVVRQNDVLKNKEDIVRFKEEYAKMIRWIYKNNDNSRTFKLAFVMQSGNFKEAWNRMKYLKKYGNYRAKQSIVIQNNINRILHRVTALMNTKQEKAQLIENNKMNQLSLENEKGKRDEMVQKLGKEMDDLKGEIAKKNRAAAEINAKIRKVIEEEIQKQKMAELAKKNSQRQAIKKANEEALAQGKKPVAREEDIENSPEGILSNSFLASKGNLPWPVSRGVVVSKFGKQPHPVASDLFIENNGIDIKTANNADVMCVYEGKVVKVFEMPSYQNCVMIKHGDFFSVYSHLSNVHVTVGSEVRAKQVIGKCAFSEDQGYALTNLQIWHYQVKQNPSIWLKAR